MEITLSMNSGIHCASVTFSERTRAKNGGWPCREYKRRDNGRPPLLSVLAIGSVYRGAEPVMKGPTTRASFEKSGEFRDRFPSRSVAPYRRRVSERGRLNGAARITFLHISLTIQRESIDETKGNVCEIAVLLRDTRDSSKETMAHGLTLRARVVHAGNADTCPRARARAKAGQASH